MTAGGDRARRRSRARRWMYVEKGAARGPQRGCRVGGARCGAPFLTGEVGLPFLAGLLLPALGFLRHCLLSPPSSGFDCESALGIRLLSLRGLYPGGLGGCRLARSPDAGPLRVGAPSTHRQLRKGEAENCFDLTRDGLSSPSSYQL